MLFLYSAAMGLGKEQDVSRTLFSQDSTHGTI